MVVVVIGHKTKAAARRALTFIVRIFVNDTITIAVWTVCLESEFLHGVGGMHGLLLQPGREKEEGLPCPGLQLVTGWVSFSSRAASASFRRGRTIDQPANPPQLVMPVSAEVCEEVDNLCSHTAREFACR
jgi:hypothetical protein